jgi:thimet oligopeptidase
MNAASAYARGRWLQNQLEYSSFSLEVHNQSPANIDFDALYQQDQKRFNDFTPVPGDHFSASFTHITGYSSNYYTYVLDKVIAIDFFSQFDKSNLLDGPTAMRYRRSVLEPGATKPAAELVKDFLGREQSIAPLQKWMNEEFETRPPGRQQATSAPQPAE